ncbi:hypothetical protein [Streptomyces sp. GESEQ-35]|uniref:hypothetical protein n=1 Tax=Streptomyces sp. GESEQ-35 TaxID=2812657 RepID=UPI001B34008F|nr:hypothetical protein [Streptomyces sp. GESEQ-35]
MTDQVAVGEGDFAGSGPGAGAVAWADPATRRAWWRQVGRGLLLIACCAAWWIWYSGVGIPVRERVVWLNVVFLLLTGFRVPVELLGELPNAYRVRRVLRAHPWHLAENPRRGVGGHSKAKDAHSAWFEVPDPAAPERRLPLVLGSVPMWWRGRMSPTARPDRRAQIARLWYSGTPGDQMVIAASRADEKAPHRLRHRYLRYGTMPENPARPDVEAPDPSLDALSHPPTRRTLRRRLFIRIALLSVLWPALLAVQIAEVVADQDHDKIGVFVVALMLEVMVLPFHIYVIVATRRMARTLAAHPWRLVDSEVRLRGRQQVITVDGRILTPSPFRVYVDSTATRLWMAGDPHTRCVVSVPGGARPIGVAMSTKDNRTR